MSDCAIVLTACASEEEAGTITRALLENGLAACVQRLRVNSAYLWKGRTENADEHLLIIKCAARRFTDIRDEIVRLHSYELPEIVMLPIREGLAGYLDWIENPNAER